MSFPPHTFANQSGNVPASELDDNFSACEPALGYTPVNRAGDTMTGALVLAGNAVNPLEAVPLQQLTTAQSPPRSYIAGLTLSTAGGSSTFGIARGAATDTTNTVMMQLASAYTKTTGAWTVGSGNGSLDFGTIANNTWLSAYLIERPDTVVTDILTSLAPGTSSTVTITVASPAVISWPAHGLQAGAPVVFVTTGALPAGIVSGTTYYVISGGLTTNAFEISATQGGSAINTTGTQSGTHTATSNPALPANYTLFRRIGSMLTDSSAHWVSFTQNGSEFLWATPLLDVSLTTTVPATAVSYTLTVPVGVIVGAMIIGGSINTGSNYGILISSLATTDTAPAAFPGLGTPGSPNAPNTLSQTVRTNTSAQIRVRLSAAGSSLSLTTQGWIDSRGANA